MHASYVIRVKINCKMKQSLYNVTYFGDQQVFLAMMTYYYSDASTSTQVGGSDGHEAVVCMGVLNVCMLNFSVGFTSHINIKTLKQSQDIVEEGIVSKMQNNAFS